MAKTKTIYTGKSVEEFVNNIENEVKRNDTYQLIDIFRSLTGEEPRMWGPSIIGFGNYHYKYASGHEGDAPLAGFSPRKDSLVFYINPEFETREELLSRLGKHTSSKSCVYAKKLADLNIPVLKKLIKACMAHTKKNFPS